MSLRIENPYPPASVDSIREFEQHTGIKLPPTYRMFLLRSNGGRPSPSIFQVPKWPGKFSGVGDFLALTPSKTASLEFWVSELRDRLDSDFIAIADDPGGNFICVGINGGLADKIYYRDSSPDWGLTEETGTMFLVANDIDEFLAKLTDTPP